MAGDAFLLRNRAMDVTFCICMADVLLDVGLHGPELMVDVPIGRATS